MNILISKVLAWSLLVGISLAVILVLSIIMYFAFGLRKKREAQNTNTDTKVTVDEEFMANLISYLGGKENINSATVDNGRVKFGVLDLEVLNTDGLKTLSTSGVFITGKNVKLLFKYDSQDILKAYESLK